VVEVQSEAAKQIELKTGSSISKQIFLSRNPNRIVGET
jgi:hypothetical protein